MASRTATLTIKILSDAKQAAAGVDQASGQMGKMQKAALPAAAVLGALGVAATAATKAAMEDAKAQATLATALKNSAGASSEQVAAMEASITAMSRASGVADDELRPAMATLVRASGDMTQAQKDMQLALDISAATGKPLETVSKALAKAYDGSTGALGKLVPGLDQAVLKSKDMAAISEELAASVGGASAAAANTAAGQMERFQLGMSEAAESAGAALLPAMETLTPILVNIANFVGDNIEVFLILAGVIAAAAAGVMIYNGIVAITTAASGAWTAAQWLLNAALSANPIAVVVIAIAALVAGLVLAYKKSETFRKIVTDAFNAVKKAVDAVADAVANVIDWFKNLKFPSIKVPDWMNKILGNSAAVASSINTLATVPTTRALATPTVTSSNTNTNVPFVQNSIRVTIDGEEVRAVVRHEIRRQLQSATVMLATPRRS